MLHELRLSCLIRQKCKDEIILGIHLVSGMAGCVFKLNRSRRLRLYSGLSYIGPMRLSVNHLFCLDHPVMSCMGALHSSEVEYVIDDAPSLFINGNNIIMIC